MSHFHHFSFIMDVKVSSLLLLFSVCSASLCSAEHVNLVVRGVTAIANTDENFICATLDWWPSSKCDYNDCPWGKAGIFNLNLYNKILSNAVKAFNPLRIRLGGSLEDRIIYQFGKQKECPVMKKKNDDLFGFSEGCLTKMRWDQIHHFVNKTGAKFTFGLNALVGKKNSNEDKLNWVGNWNPANAIGLMEYTVSRGYKIDSYELGNELCGGGVGARIDSVQYAKDLTRLRHIVNLLYPDESTRPKVLGPAGFFDKKWFETFLQNLGPGVVDGITHHIYNLGAGNDKNLINKIQDPFYLSQVAQTFKDVSTAVKEFAPWSGPWVGESGGAYNSGGKDVSPTFANGFWYLDQLGMTSTYNHKVYCRQALIGGNYALLNTTTFIPNPDYYGALLWHRLMGSKVLFASHEGSPYLRAYAHCSKHGPGITVLLINMAKSTTFRVSLINDMNLYQKKFATEGNVTNLFDSLAATDKREEYHLTPKDGNIQSNVVLLNGTPLRLTESLNIPKMKPKLVDASSTITVKHDSIVFAHIKGFKAPACD